jgi:hypothetical protein
MVGSMTIITTFITPYMVKIGWKVADVLEALANNNKDKNKKILRRLGLFKFLKDMDNTKKKNNQQ